MKAIRIFALNIGLTILLASCATVEMADGRRSILIDDDLRFRERLVVDRIANPIPFRYKPTPPCTIHIEGAPARTLGTIYDRTSLADRLSVSVRQVRDRYVISIVDGHRRPSTLTVTGLGQRTDHNLVGLLSQDGRLSRGDPSSQIQHRLADGSDRPLDPDLFYRRYEFAFPAFDRANANPGEIVGTIQNLDGSAWASLRYQGVVGSANRRHALLDLVAQTSRGEEVMMGFAIVDLSTMLPRNVTVWDGTRFHVSMRSDCAAA